MSSLSHGHVLSLTDLAGSAARGVARATLAIAVRGEPGCPLALCRLRQELWIIVAHRGC